MTGGAGFIGSNLTLALQDRRPDSQITVVDSLTGGTKENLSEYRGHLLEEDVSDHSLIRRLVAIRPNVIFHMAALTDTRLTDRQLMYRINVEGFRNMLDVGVECGSIVVYASSAAVYGINPAPLSETSPLKPTNIYGESKVAMEDTARSYCDRYPQLKVLGFRYFNVYGPRESHKKDYASMIFQLAQQIRAGRRPRIFRGGEQKRDFIYIKDVVELTLRALDAPRSGIYNAGTGLPISFNEIVTLLNKVLRTRYEPEFFENPYPFYQPHTEADMANTKKELNFTPRYGIVEGVTEYLTDYFQNK